MKYDRGVYPGVYYCSGRIHLPRWLISGSMVNPGAKHPSNATKVRR